MWLANSITMLLITILIINGLKIFRYSQLFTQYITWERLKPWHTLEGQLTGHDMVTLLKRRSSPIFKTASVIVTIINKSVCCCYIFQSVMLETRYAKTNNCWLTPCCLRMAKGLAKLFWNVKRYWVLSSFTTVYSNIGSYQRPPPLLRLWTGTTQLCNA